MFRIRTFLAAASIAAAVAFNPAASPGQSYYYYDYSPGYYSYSYPYTYSSSYSYSYPSYYSNWYDRSYTYPRSFYRKPTVDARIGISPRWYPGYGWVYY